MLQPNSRFLTANWLTLAMLNYEIEPTVLLKRVPPGTELDTWNGKTFVSIVGFRFCDTRLLGIPVPLHRDFDEVNLRFYVRRNSLAGLRRGVVFIKEIVPRIALAWIARWVYNEDYIALAMRHHVSLPSKAPATLGQVSYEWRYGQHWNRLAVQIAGKAYLPDEQSEEAFITEHYWGYASQRDNSTLEYQVEHPRWQVWRADQAEFHCDVTALYGSEFTEFLSGAPTSAFVATGSAVTVRRGVRIAIE